MSWATASGSRGGRAAPAASAPAVEQQRARRSTRREVGPGGVLKHRMVAALSAALIATALGLSLVLLPGPTAAAEGSGYWAQSPEYGVSVFVYGNPNTTARDLGQVRALGFGWQKSLFRWRDLEGACKGCFDWTEADRVVRASTDAGLKIIARLDFPPTWARTDGAHNGAPDNYQDFADFVYAFVDRYKHGSPYGTVQAIEIWNEVNLQREWGSPIDRSSAAAYVRLLDGAYRAAKAADPQVTVITAGLSPTGWNDATARPDDDYLQWLYEAGMAGKYDVLGANGNVQCPSVDAAFGACPVMADRMSHPSFYFRRIEQLRDIMVANGEGGKQIWLMEFGWTTDRVNPNYSWYATTEERKADLIVQAFQYARSNWAPWIGVMTLWTLADPRWSPQDEQLWWAITNPDGTPRPAYTRLLQARKNGELPGIDAQGSPGAAQASAPPAQAAAPSAPAQPQDAPAPAARLRVVDPDGAGVNLRAGPGLSVPVVKVLPSGTIVTPLGDPVQSDGVNWRPIRDQDGTEGWIAADYLAPA